MKSFSKSAAVVAGGLMFASVQANAAGVILTEDFEGSSGNTWTFNSFDTSANYSDSPHSGIPSGGSTYGWAPDGSTTVDLGGTAVVGDTVSFDGWLANWAAIDPEYSVVTIEFFDAVGGGGSSLGAAALLVDGGGNVGVIEHVNSAGVLTPGVGTTTNSTGTVIAQWQHYQTSMGVAVGAQSAVVTYDSFAAGAPAGNDAYADNIVISTTVVPEPGSLALLGLGGLLIARRRRA